MLRCIARVKPIRDHHCHDKRRGEEFLIELDCDQVSDEELRNERYALQNERALQEKLRELERTRRRFCRRRHHR